MEPVDVTLDEYPVFADSLLADLPKVKGQATVVALQGDLGAGKTTTTQAIAACLGVEETVTSPTFVVQKNYATQDQRWSKLVHIDAYRIEDLRELGPLRLSELWYASDTLVVVEWPERIKEALPSHVSWFQLTALNDVTRRIEPVAPHES